MFSRYTTPLKFVAGRLGAPVRAITSSHEFGTARLMLPDDANPLGIVHGGVTLKMLEQAGFVIAARHCNSQLCTKGPQQTSNLSSNGPAYPILPVLAHLSNVDFVGPMNVGELSKLYAFTTFTSNHSVEVLVDVFAENLMKGTTRKTNSALLTYVGTDPSQWGKTTKCKPVDIPPLIPEDDWEAKVFEDGKQRYLQRRASMLAQSQNDFPEPITPTMTLAAIMLPSEAFGGKNVAAGVIMKLMDETSGCAAIRHCGQPVVTASLDALDILHGVSVGDIVHVHAAPVFASSKSLDVEVWVEVERMGHAERIEATRGFFTFVALRPDRKPADVPPVKPKTSAEKHVFDRRAALYEQRKRARK